MLSQWLLQAAAIPADRQTLRDGADLLARFGLDDSAALLRTVAQLIHGAPRIEDVGASAASSPIAAAADTLAGLMDIPAEGAILTHRPTAGPTPVSLASLCGELAEILAAPLDEQVETRLAAVLRGLRDNVADKAGDPPADGLRDPSQLALWLAARTLRPWLRVARELACPPHGSPRLLHAVAAPGSLGAYLSGVRRLVRGPGELFGLIHLAATRRRATKTDAALFTRWVLLLSMHHQPHERGELAEEAGDLGLPQLLRDLARRERHLPPEQRSQAALWHLRDAALDTGQPRLAAHVQRIVATTWPERQIEWQVLSEVQMAAGRRGPARSAILRTLRLAPDSAEGRARLEALDKGPISQFAAVRGYGTVPLRRLIRRTIMESGEAG